MTHDQASLSCPSAQPDMVDARIFAVVGGTMDEPRLAYLKKGAQIDAAQLDRLGDIEPTQVFRYAARCEASRCAQFAGGRCSLGARVAEGLPPVVDSLPSCQIRDTCRWFHEAGGAACLRCPQVMTLVPETHAMLRKLAQPDGAGVLNMHSVEAH